MKPSSVESGNTRSRENLQLPDDHILSHHRADRRREDVPCLTLCVKACRQRYWSLYLRMPGLMRYFEANRDNRLLMARYRKQLCNYQLLVIDELLNYKVSENDAKILYEIFDGRHEKHPTVFLGQHPRDE